MRRPGLYDLVRRHPPQPPVFLNSEVEYQAAWHSPAGLDFADAGPVDPHSSAAYLAVAHGLSVERAQWPDFVYPGDVPPLGGGRRAPDPFERSYGESDVG